jgi:hypothetical protein
VLTCFETCSSCGAIEQIEDMVTSFLTQLAFSDRSSCARSMSDEPTSDCGSEVDELRPKVLKGKSRIELQLADRSKRTALGSASLIDDISFRSCTLNSLSRVANYKYLRYPRKSSTSSAKPFG